MSQKLKEIIERYPITALFIVFLLAELIIHPIGNFPLNDDWWYANSYKKIFEEYTHQKIPWGATSLVGQLFLTKLFAVIFGYSYTAMRFFTLTLSFFTMIFIFKILKEHFKLETFNSFILSAIFLFSPLFLSLSNSYMSDVPFLFFITGGFYFYLLFVKNRSLLIFVSTVIFFVFAILTRQLSIVFLFAILLSEFILSRRVGVFTLIIFIIPALALFAFESWIQTKINNPIYTYVFFRQLPILNKIAPQEIFINVCKRWIHFINYSGFVLFPILIPYLFHYLKKIHYKIITKEFIFAALLYIPVAISMNKFPLGNYLFNFGIGPDTLYDFFTPEYGQTLEAPVLFFFMKIIAYVSSFALLIALGDTLFKTFGDLKRETLVTNSNELTLILCLGSYYIAMCCTCAIFDRYIMPFTLFIVFLLHKQFVPQFSKPLPSYILFFLLIIFSTVGTKDYLNSNRARWEVISILKKEYHATDKEINAGYEHEGSSFPDTEDWYTKWLNIVPTTYMVSRQNIKGYTKLGSHTYWRFLTLKKDTIFYLKLDTIATN